MRVQEKQKALEQEVIANLCAIPKMPENMWRIGHFGC